MKMTRELIGHIGVDSGSVMLVDPCYFNDPLRWDTVKILELANEAKLNGNLKQYENSMRIYKNKKEIQNIVKDWDQYCNEYKNEPRKYAGGIISPTGGDGTFAVYITKDKTGKIKKMEIVF